MLTPKRTKNITGTSPELVVKLNRLTPEDMRKYTQSFRKKIKYGACDPRTPQASIELSKELKIVINERNILTSKTRKRVFEALDEIKSKTEEETRKFKRERALLEIVNSEIKYINQLQTIINFFMKPVQERKLLKADDYETLFGNINTIYNINKELLEELDKGFHNVANAFTKIAPFLKLYSVYAYNFRNNLRILQNARSTNPIFAKFVENQETRPEVQSKLSALLITPIQRVPRYKLLVSHLYELTTPKDKDFKLLTECLIKIREAATHINKVVEEQENAQRLLELQRYLRSGELNIITPGRKLRKEGILHKMSTRNCHSEKLYVVLMSDIIMFNKMKKEELAVNSLKVYSIFPLNKCKAIEVLDKGCFKIECQQEELILYHDQLREMVTWIENIQQAIDEYLEDRKTLRKESSNRRAVKRKDVNEYHEVGLSPGQPLKKRKFSEFEPPMASPRLQIRVTARKSIHPACNSTPVKLESNPETNYISNPVFSRMNTTDFSSGSSSNLDKDTHDKERKEDTNRQSDLQIAKHNNVFVFGQKHEDHNTSKLGSFFKGFGSSIKGFLGFGGNKVTQLD